MYQAAIEYMQRFLSCEEKLKVCDDTNGITIARHFFSEKQASLKCRNIIYLHTDSPGGDSWTGNNQQKNCKAKECNNGNFELATTSRKTVKQNNVTKSRKEQITVMNS